MRIIVSACLLGENCKYDGGNNLSAAVKAFLLAPAPDGSAWEPVAVCPERMGGLPCPRKPAEIVDGTVRTKDGDDVNAAFRLGAERAMAAAANSGAKYAILKSFSPSCGPDGIYDGTFSHTRVSGRGLFADALIKSGVRVSDEKKAPCFFAEKHVHTD